MKLVLSTTKVDKHSIDGLEEAKAISEISKVLQVDTPIVDLLLLEASIWAMPNSN